MNVFSSIYYQMNFCVDLTSDYFSAFISLYFINILMQGREMICLHWNISTVTIKKSSILLLLSNGISLFLSVLEMSLKEEKMSTI